jgi:hypothetical protein
MRQWELFGITDGEPTPSTSLAASPAVAEDEVENDDSDGPLPEVLWSTDAALRITFAAWEAAELLGLPTPTAGVNLLDVFGLEGTGAGVVAAHVAALCGRQATFSIDLPDRSIRCRVVPLRGEEEEVSGTICVGVHEVGVPDLTVVDDDTEPIRVA